MSSATDRGYGVGLSPSAWEKRNKQLENWKASETNREPSYPIPRRTTKSRVHFSKDVMFLAAVNAGDEQEVERLLSDEKADVNCRNNDGLTAVHQCCIDDDIDMLKLVIKRGGDINAIDKEGWTPLHAAASCGHKHIIEYLLECGAFPASINNEGQTPSDLAEDYDEIIDLLQSEVNRLGIDIEDIKCEEERIMLEDANKLRNNPDLEMVVSSSGATPLHVAASKNYTTVLNVLLSIKELDINARDDDGWTPLHAAVHWESMEAAELLILNGANVYAKTDAGEELDDLIDPDLEEELKALKKLNSYINPEQEQRKRRHQISRRTSNTFTHSNSFDNKYQGHQPITRRHSKEKLTMIDMKKEKEDLMHSFEKLDEEINLSNSPTTGGISAQAPPTSRVDHNPSSSNINASKGSSSTPVAIPASAPPPMVRTNSSGSNGGGSPKNSRRKGEMSKNMLDRLNVFEASNSSGQGTPNAATVVPVSTSSTASPRTSTPVSTPPVNANGTNNERKKVESADSSLRLRVTSSDAAGSQTSNARNRFSFQPKPVLGGNLQPKTMSLDRGAEHVFRDVSAAYDAQNHTPKAELEPKIETTPRTVVESKTMKKKDIPEQTTPTNTSTPTTGQEATPTKVDCSAASTDSSLTINDRSATSQPEARRRTNAKTKRETRRSTQPLPTDLLERITKHDQMEEDQLKMSTPTATTNEKQANNAIKDTPIVSAVAPALPSSTEPPKIVANHVDVSSAHLTTPTSMSQDRVPAYSKETKHVPVATPTSTKEQKTSSNTSPKDQVATPTSGSKDYLATPTSDTSSPQLPRTKSGARRKPKEKRRSTGIPTEVDSECEIPDNLKGIINHSRSESADSTDSNGIVNNVFDIQGTEDTSLSTSTIEYYQQEMATLKKLLADERKKNETVTYTYQHTCAKLDNKEKELLELRSKYDEMMSILERERTESEQKERRISQLEKSQKGIQELKTEIQRLKDENGALIRVVGKLSRAPFTS